jgi:glycine C-acetyltransferase
VRTDPLRHVAQELGALRAQGRFRWPRELQSAQAPRAVYDGRLVVNLCSNNYLALADDPRLKEAAKAAVDRYGTGSGAVRTIAGSLQLHRELEEALARFKGTEATLLYPSGFAANAGTVAALLGPEDVVVSDELNHASIIDGCRLSGAVKRIYRHRDTEHARELLEASQDARLVLLVTDGVFSMDGDVAPLPELCALAKRYGALLMVDDAHATGVLGRGGRGTVDHFGLAGQVDIQVGTLSKALATVGGYVAASRSLVEYLMHRARPVLFSTSLPPAVAGAALRALQILEQEPERLERLWDNTRTFKRGLEQLGFRTGQSETPITPVLTGDEDLAMALSDGLFEEGVFALGISYPTVPRGQARVRTIVTAGHTQQDLDFALGAFERVGRRLGLI